MFHRRIMLMMVAFLLPSILAQSRAFAQKPPIVSKDELPNGACLRISLPDSTSVSPLSFWQHGKSIVFRTDSGVYSTDIATGKSVELARFDVHIKIQGCAFSPALNRLTTFRNGVFKHTDVTTGEPKGTFFGPKGLPPSFIRYSPDNQFMIWESGNTITLANTNDNNTILSIGRGSGILAVAVSSNDSFLAVNYVRARGHRIEVWDLAKHRLLSEIVDEETSVGAGGLSLNSDGTKLAIGMHPNVRIWDVSEKKFTATLPESGNPLLWVADHHAIAIRTVRDRSIPPGTIRLLEVYTGTEIMRLVGHKSASRHLISDELGRYLATSDGLEVILWDLYGGGPRTPRDIDEQRFAELWAQMDSSGAESAYPALAELMHCGDRAVAHLRKLLRPSMKADGDLIRRLVVELDDSSFERRERASRLLAAMGELAEDELQRILSRTPSAETRRRIEKILRNESKVETWLPGQLQRLRAIHLLERIGSKEARLLLEDLAKGGSWSQDTRLARQAVARLNRRSLTWE